MTDRTLRHAVRRLLRARTFTLAATLTLTIGLGTATVVFTLVNGVLLRPLPFDHPEQLVDLSHALRVGGLSTVDQSDATYLYYRRANRVFTDVGAYRSAAANMGQAGDGSSARHLSAALITPSVLRVLHETPARGRGFVDSEGEPGAPPTVLIGERLWRQQFGGDAGILGRRVTVDGVSREIVGVLPAAFRFPAADVELWLPLVLDPAHTKSAAFDYRGIARLRAGTSLAAASADLAALLPRVPEAFPGRLTASSIAAIHMEPVVRPLRDVIIGDVSRTLWIILAAAGALLAIAIANVVNLYLARAEARQREVAVRSALGASRAALVTEVSAEALILAVVGALLGLAVAIVGLRLFQSFGQATSIPRLSDVSVDGSVLLVAAGLAACAGLIVSALPALHVERALGRAGASLMLGGRGPTAERGRHGVRRALVIAQVSLALTLLVGAGLLARSFARLSAVDPGFAADRALAWRVSLPSVTYPASADAARLIHDVIASARDVSGVEAVGAVTRLPLDPEARQDSAVFLEDHPLKPGEIPGIHEIVFASPEYFAAMKIPLVAGRLFAPLDPAVTPDKRPPEVIVANEFAARYWQSAAAAIGKRIRMTPVDPWYTIVGVVGDVHNVALDKPADQVVYSQLVTNSVTGRPYTPRDVAFVARTTGDPAALASTVERVVAARDPRLPLYRVIPVQRLLSEATARARFTLAMLGVAAIVATLLGALGIYGVVSYLVSLRTREIGVRLALGAQRGDVVRLVTRQALTDASIGVAVGVVGALLATRALAALLFGVSPTDVQTLAGASALLVLTALSASWIPARRAAGLDPAAVLRDE